MTRALAVASGLRRFTGNAAQVSLRWESAERLAKVSDVTRGSAASYPPGNCAAQRALLLLINDNALPAAMTEEWYHDQGQPTQSPIEYIDAKGPTHETKAERFADRDTVPPCKTCDIVIPMALCTQGEAACNHQT